MAKEVTIKLENENGVEETFKAGKIMARTTRDAMKMYSKMEQVDEKGNPVLKDDESLDMMLELVADSIFKRVPQVTVDTILDGVVADELTDVLQDVIMAAMGIEEDDVKEVKEGK